MTKTTTTEDFLHELAAGPNIGSGAAFWYGDGDDLLERLYEEGWGPHRYEAPYYWVVKFTPPVRIEPGAARGDGSLVIEPVRYISYTEGDVDFEDNPCCGS
jgi:hypothetical protein